ncbi:hypothetical protein BDA99DRAFT_513185 [Phascolomyces articulosus]|uniref:F-box domain-containing protein n=1 Tax=Phascolomyces articulosus TaxID=60185 RepID=A0AAD5JXS8_9FUNG|nr:hypothetical protein BDA99DRAFT_513185 [Phascolomyces articulosus]
MSIPTLPTEVIILIISYLPRAHIIRLLTVNRHWHNVISAQLYRTLCIHSLREQYEYRNLFNETRRRRQRQQQQLQQRERQKHSSDQENHQQQPQLTMSGGADTCSHYQVNLAVNSNNSGGGGNNGFYSTENYGQYVRELDLSVPYSGKDITDALFYDLALDCPNLETLNLYNCHKVTTNAVKRALSKCKKIRFLYLSMATSIDARCLQEAVPHQLHTLNIFGIPHFFFRYRPAALLTSLKSLKAGQWLDRQTIDLMNGLEHVSLDGMHPEHISQLIQCNKHLRSVRLVRCQLHPPLLGHLMTQKHLTALELHRCKLIHDHHYQQHRQQEEEGGQENIGDIHHGRDDNDGMSLVHFPRYQFMQRLEFKYMIIPSIQRIVEQCSDRLVSFIAPYNISDTVLDTLSTNCPRLKRLSLVTRSNGTGSHINSTNANNDTATMDNNDSGGNTNRMSNTGSGDGSHFSLDCLQRTLHSLTSTLVYLELSIQPSAIVEQVLLQWPNPNLQILILRLRVSILLLQNLPSLYPALRVLYIASTEPATETEIDQYLLGQDKLQHLEALMLYDRRDSANRDYLALKNHYDYWSLRKEIW